MGTFQQYYDKGRANLQRHEEFKGFTARKSIKFSLQLPTREAGEDRLRLRLVIIRRRRWNQVQ